MLKNKLFNLPQDRFVQKRKEIRMNVLRSNTGTKNGNDGLTIQSFGDIPDRHRWDFIQKHLYRI